MQYSKQCKLISLTQLCPYLKRHVSILISTPIIKPLNVELSPICSLLALLGAYHFLHVSRIRVKSLTLRLLMSPAEIVGSNPTEGMNICLL